jgi:hypothetical protein
LRTNRLLAVDRLDRHARLDRRDVELGGGFGQHVLRRSHLADQRIERGDAADARGGDRRDIDEIAATYAFPPKLPFSAQRFGLGVACGGCHCLALPAGSPGREPSAEPKKIDLPRTSEAPGGAAWPG